MAKTLLPHWFFTGETIPSATTNYTTVGASAVEGDSSVAVTERPVRDAGTFSDLRVRVSAITMTDSSTYKLFKSGVATSIVATITTSVGDYTDLSNTAAFAATDEATFQIITGTTGTSLTIKLVSLVFAADTNTVTLIGINQTGSTDLSVASTTTFFNVSGNRRSLTTPESETQLRIQKACVWQDLFLIVGTVTRTTTTNLTVEVATATPGNQTIAAGTGSNTTYEDAANTDTLAAGADIAQAFVTGTGTGNFNVEKVTSSLVNTAGQGFAQVAGSAERMNDGLTRFWPMGGTMISGEEATESEVQLPVPFGMTLSNLTAKMSRITGGVTATYRSRIPAGDGNQSVVLTAVSVGTDASNTDVVTASQNINMQVSSPAVGTNFDTQYVSMVHAETVAAGRVMGSLAGLGGLAGPGGIAGHGGGLAG